MNSTDNDDPMIFCNREGHLVPLLGDVDSNEDQGYITVELKRQLLDKINTLREQYISSERWFIGLFGAGFVSVIVCGGVTVRYGIDNTIGLVGAFVGLGVGTVSFISAILVAGCAASSSKDEKVQSFIRTSKMIDDFSSSFELFQKNPEHLKMASLIKLWEKIASEQDWYDFVVQHKLVEEEELIFFKPVGKLILLDAILEKLPRTKSAIGWVITPVAESPRSLNELETMWKQIGLATPDQETYNEFYEIQDTITSHEIAKKIKDVFETTLQCALEKKLI